MKTLLFVETGSYVTISIFWILFAHKRIGQARYKPVVALYGLAIGMMLFGIANSFWATNVWSAYWGGTGVFGLVAMYIGYKFYNNRNVMLIFHAFSTAGCLMYGLQLIFKIEGQTLSVVLFVVYAVIAGVF